MRVSDLTWRKWQGNPMFECSQLLLHGDTLIRVFRGASVPDGFYEVDRVYLHGGPIDPPVERSLGSYYRQNPRFDALDLSCFLTECRLAPDEIPTYKRAS